ncbi:MAG: N-acetylneuraminate synthase family protein [bacterium]|nr:N-acetylneuraminate synthase family protein [bacterium]
MNSNVVNSGGILVGDHRIFLVAEIGINHNGDVGIAKKLVDVAVEAGWNAVKFQKRTVDVVYTPEELARPRENPFGSTNGDLKRGLEFGQDEYREIDRHCKEKGIIWFASCWDEQSVDFIDQFSPPCYKIASASLTDDNLLRYTKGKGKPVIISTGMSTLEQVDHAVSVLGVENLVLMHCVATYPADWHELNLRVIQTLRERYRVPVGYSGHEVGLYPSLTAVALGACMVERHITLNRAMWGTDQSASIEHEGCKKLAEEIRIFEQSQGDGVKKLLESEIPVMKKLRRKG